MKQKMVQLIKELFRVTVWKRRAFFLIADTVLISFSLYTSFWLRFDGRIPAEFLEQFLLFLAIFLAVKLIFLHFPECTAFPGDFLGPWIWRGFAGVDELNYCSGDNINEFAGSQYLGGSPGRLFLLTMLLPSGF